MRDRVTTGKVAAGKRRAIWILAILAATVIVAVAFWGIGNEGYPADGVVLYEGLPLENATVTLVPLSSRGLMASGVTDREGKFTLSTAGQAGVSRGAYRVAIRALDENDDDELVYNASLPVAEQLRVMKELMMREKKMTKFRIPRHYASAFESGLTVTVKAVARNHFRFELDSEALSENSP